MNNRPHFHILAPLLALILAVAALASCQRSEIITAYKPVSTAAWEAGEKLVFEVGPIEEEGDYILSLELRTTEANAYPYKDLAVEVQQFWSLDDDASRDSLRMANDSLVALHRRTIETNEHRISSNDRKCGYNRRAAEAEEAQKKAEMLAAAKEPAPAPAKETPNEAKDKKNPSRAKEKSSRAKENPSRDKGTSSRDKEKSSRDKGTSSRDKGTSSRDDEKSSSKKRSSSKDKDSKSKDSKHRSSRDKDSKEKDSKHRSSKDKDAKKKDSKHRSSKDKDAKKKDSKHRSSKEKDAKKKDSKRTDSKTSTPKPSSEPTASHPKMSAAPPLRERVVNRDSLMAASDSLIKVNASLRLDIERMKAINDTIDMALAQRTMVDTLTFRLNGDALPSTGIAVRQYSLPVGTLHLFKGQKARITIRHIMRMESLSGVSDIGITLERQ